MKILQVLKGYSSNEAMLSKPIRLLVLGQTPPPYMGQAIAVQNFVSGSYHELMIVHVRMAFSTNIEDIGKVRMSKFIHLISLIMKIVYNRFRYRLEVLFYLPAGPNMVPMLRDLAILLCTRWLFRKTVFHFQAGGLSELYDKLPPFIRYWFRRAYFFSDLAIQLSDLNPPDGKLLMAKRTVIVPNGIKDEYPIYMRRSDLTREEPIILFVGILRESKGVMVLLEACRILRENNTPFKVRLMGRFESEQFQSDVDLFLDRHGLRDRTEILGVLTGDRKWECFADADLLCFPSHFESETFGIVVVEGMQFELPVVATRWRGIPSIVDDGVSGFLIPIKCAASLAEKLSVLIRHPELRVSMGRQGRMIFFERYTLAHYCRNMEAAIKLLI